MTAPDERVAALAVVMRRTGTYRRILTSRHVGARAVWFGYARAAAWGKLTARAWSDLADAHLGRKLVPTADDEARGRAADRQARHWDRLAELARSAAELQRGAIRAAGDGGGSR